MDIKPSEDKVYQLQGDIRVIVGTTTIMHRLRAELKLTMCEYVLLDFIHQWHSNPKNKQNPITFGDYFRATGVKARLINKKFARLKDKGMLFKDVADGKVKTTDKWNSNFNSSEQFETLWKMLNTGTKNVAKTQFAKCLKVDNFENIKAGLIKYLAYVDKIDWMSPKHLSSFLNPKNKEWTGEFDPSIYKKKEPLFTKSVQAVTGPQSKF